MREKGKRGKDKMIIQDDRTNEQKETHNWLVIGTDTFMSGWHFAKNGKSYAAWACKPEDRWKVLNWVESRSDMIRVREVSEEHKRYQPKGNGHCHIYVVTDNHPVLKRKRMISKPRTLDEYVRLKTVWRRVLIYCREHNLKSSNVIEKTDDRWRLVQPRYGEVKRIILNDKKLYQMAKQENVTDLPH